MPMGIYVRHRRTNLIGQKFNRLTVIGEARTSRGEAAWECKCECGNTTVSVGHALKNGRTSSCGCYMIEVARKHGYANRKHGCKGTRVYKSHDSMKQRCLNPDHKSYPKYGGRGITICERWLKFEAFLEDMGHPPEKHSLDRIEVDGNYEPSNCRWADAYTQQRNKRDNHLLTAFGETKCAIAWLEDPRCRCNRASLYKRIQNKWNDIDAITTPMKKQSNRRDFTNVR